MWCGAVLNQWADPQHRLLSLLAVPEGSGERLRCKWHRSGSKLSLEPGRERADDFSIEPRQGEVLLSDLWFADHEQKQRDAERCPRSPRHRRVNDCRTPNGPHIRYIQGDVGGDRRSFTSVSKLRARPVICPITNRSTGRIAASELRR
jgi:hypothetical protein